MLAFVILVLGALIYNEILVVPIDIMKRNTKKELEKKEAGKLDADGLPILDRKNNLILSSPGAAYDSTRNSRNLANKMKERDVLIDKHQRNHLGSDDNSDFMLHEDNGTGRSGR